MVRGVDFFTCPRRVQCRTECSCFCGHGRVKADSKLDAEMVVDWPGYVVDRFAAARSGRLAFGRVDLAVTWRGSHAYRRVARRSPRPQPALCGAPRGSCRLTPRGGASVAGRRTATGSTSRRTTAAAVGSQAGDRGREGCVCGVWLSELSCGC